jgi:hypothetical protein
MSEREESSSGIIGQFRRLSRRFSATLLNVEAKHGPNLIHGDRKPIYSYDDDEQMRIGICHKNLTKFISNYHFNYSSDQN